ncbi:hypothetical protein ABZT02_22430 [Streptomyces sp. NPDC005402]|uniref:hypothetical protein n=1 Tax=Streptomyces sp. NPDC005402 TaxID=3155338 RepID=UPI0033A312F4
MSWTRGLLALLAVCVLLVTGSVSCGANGAQERKDGQSVSPVGKVLDDTDHEGRHYREVDKENAPDVGIVVQPDTDDSWSVRLTVENFTFSPATTKAKAVSGRGVAVLFVDDRPVTTLRAPSYHLAAAYVPQGTHKVTARLYADDGTVWAVDGTPVESTADVTASEPRATGGGASESGVTGSGGSESGVMRSAGGVSGSRVVTGAGSGASGARSFTRTSLSGGASGSQLTVSGGGDVLGSQAGADPGDVAATRAGVGVGTAWNAAATGGGVPAPQAGGSTGGAVSEARLLASAGGDAAPQVDSSGGGTAAAAQPAAATGGGVPAPQAGGSTGIAASPPAAGTGAADGTAAQAQPVTSAGGGR